MKIFVTGASGFIGKALVKELFAHGHMVLALARTDTAAIALAATGAQIHLSDLEDLDSLKPGAAACDGVVTLVTCHQARTLLRRMLQIEQL